MPQLAWDPIDLLDAIGVVPVIAEYEVSYHYRLMRGNIVLELTVWPMNPDVTVKLFVPPQPEPLVNLQLLDCPSARVVRDRSGASIEFAGAKAFGGRYDETTAPPYGYRLRIEPVLQIEAFTYPV